MKKQAGKPKKAALKRRWFESKVAALRTALEKLPPDRQQQLKRKLKQEQC